MALELNESNFVENTGEGLVLVDFYAHWCGPCRVLAPVLENLTEVKVVKVNTDESPELAGQFKVNALPTVVFLKEGDEVERSVGVQSRSKLQEVVDRLNS